MTNRLQSYLFKIKVFATVRVNAESERQAGDMITACDYSIEVHTEPSTMLIVDTEVDTQADLVEVDGEGA